MERAEMPKTILEERELTGEEVELLRDEMLNEGVNPDDLPPAEKLATIFARWFKKVTK